MRTSLAIASAGAVFLGMIAPVFAQPATTPTQTGPGFNTSGPAGTNTSNPSGHPLSGNGPPPAYARTHPGDSASSQAPATTTTTTGPGFNTGPAGQVNAERTRTEPSGQLYPGPNQKTAEQSRHGVSADTTGTAPSLSHPQYNTSEPGAVNAGRPGNPPPAANYYGESNGKP